MYSLVIFFTAVSSLFFLKYLASKNNMHFWLYILSTLLGLYTFYLFGFVILVQGLYLVVRKPSKDLLVRWILGQTLICLFFLPWFIYFLTHLRNQGRNFSEDFLWRIPYIFYTFSMGYSGFLLNYFEKLNLFQTLKNNFPIIGFTMIIFGIISIRGLFKMFQKEHEWAGKYIIMNLFIPILALMILWKIIPLLSERYLSFVSVYYYILLAAGITSFQGYWVRAILLLSVFLLTAFSLKIYYFEPKFGKEQWREIAHEVQQNAKDSDAILFHKDYIAGIFNYYYKENQPEFGIPEHAIPNKSSDLIEMKDISKDGILTRFGERKSYRLSNSETLSNNSVIKDPLFISCFSHYKRIWFVEAKNYDTDDFYSKLLNKYFVQVDHQIYPKMNGINLYLYEVHATP